jgi:hypothetical protein
MLMGPHFRIQRGNLALRNHGLFWYFQAFLSACPKITRAMYIKREITVQTTFLFHHFLLPL